MNNNILNMINSLQHLKSAFKEVNNNWDKCDLMDNLYSDYPFSISFDELTFKVEDWVDESIKELNDFNKEL